MKQLWNRQNKLNKFIAFCLALVLAVVPLMTYVGDKEGAKAEGGSTTVSEYNFTLTEDTDSDRKGLDMDVDASGKYYMKFKSDGSYEQQTISYYTDEVKFSVEATLADSYKMIILYAMYHIHRDLTIMCICLQAKLIHQMVMLPSIQLTHTLMA